MPIAKSNSGMAELLSPDVVRHTLLPNSQRIRLGDFQFKITSYQGDINLYNMKK